jgi:hypothetical protein
VKLDLLTNAKVVDDAIRFVSEKAAAVASNAEPKNHHPIIIEDEKQRVQESYNSTTTLNQVF